MRTRQPGRGGRQSPSYRRSQHLVDDERAAVARVALRKHVVAADHHLAAERADDASVAKVLRVDGAARDVAQEHAAHVRAEYVVASNLGEL